LSELFKHNEFSSEDQKITSRMLKLAQYAQVAYNSRIKFPVIEVGQKPQQVETGMNSMIESLPAFYLELIRADLRSTNPGTLGTMMGRSC